MAVASQGRGDLVKEATVQKDETTTFKAETKPQDGVKRGPVQVVARVEQKRIAEVKAVLLKPEAGPEALEVHVRARDTHVEAAPAPALAPAREIYAREARGIHVKAREVHVEAQETLVQEREIHVKKVQATADDDSFETASSDEGIPHKQSPA